MRETLCILIVSLGSHYGGPLYLGASLRFPMKEFLCHTCLTGAARG